MTFGRDPSTRRQKSRPKGAGSWLVSCVPHRRHSGFDRHERTTACDPPSSFWKPLGRPGTVRDGRAVLHRRHQIQPAGIQVSASTGFNCSVGARRTVAATDVYGGIACPLLQVVWKSFPVLRKAAAVRQRAERRGSGALHGAKLDKRFI